MIAMLSIAIIGCTPESQDTPQTPEEERPQNPEEVPSEAPFTIKVYDISAVMATVEVEPLDQNAPYYTDIINDSDFQEATKYGFNDYMAWFLEKMEAQTGKSRQEVVKMISSYGNDGFILTTLDPETKYHAFAVGIDSNGMTTTEVVSVEFTTPAKEESENTFSIKVEDVTSDMAAINVTASCNDPYIIAIEPASVTKEMKDEDVADYLIQSNLAWGGLEQMTFTGSQKIEYEGKAGWEYEVIIFGYNNGTTTTDVMRHPFTMAEGGDPAACTFTFWLEFKDFEMNVKVNPSDNSVVYACNIIKKADLDYLEECLEDLIAEVETDCGNHGRAIDLMTIMGEQNYSLRFEPATEYVQWAVPLNQDGEPTADFSISEPFTSPEEAVSSASIRLKEYTCYNGTELAEAYPDVFKNAKGYAVVDMTVEPSEDASTWWSYIAMEDLTDRSREVIIKNLTNSLTEPGLIRQLVVAYWGVNTIMGVAQDSDGVYGPLMLEVVNLDKATAAPASRLDMDDL